MPILRKLYSLLIDLFETLVIAGGIFVVIYAFLFRPYQVNGESMLPNYHHGEYILTNLVTLHFNDIVKGEVIVFKAPNDDKKDYIKRVIATPGDKVKIENGRVFINGSVLREDEYLPDSFITTSGQFIPEGEEKIVPENHYFVLGDHRGASSDSRDWGFVGKDEVIGKSMVVYWPPQEFKIIKRAEYEN